MEVYKAINAVQNDLAKIGISKDKKNVQQNYKFRGIDDVYDALAPLLAEHKLCIIPFAINRTVVERETKAGGTLFYVTVECEFHFVSAVDGSRHVAKTFGEAMDSGDKATNKAMSAAYKYAAFQTFCIPVDVVDADAVTPPEVKPKTAMKDYKAKIDAIDAAKDVPLEVGEEARFISQNENDQVVILKALAAAHKHEAKKPIEQFTEPERLKYFRFLAAKEDK